MPVVIWEKMKFILITSCRWNSWRHLEISAARETLIQCQELCHPPTLVVVMVIDGSKLDVEVSREPVAGSEMTEELHGCWTPQGIGLYLKERERLKFKKIQKILPLL